MSTFDSGREVEKTKTPEFEWGVGVKISETLQSESDVGVEKTGPPELKSGVRVEKLESPESKSEIGEEKLGVKVGNQSRKN